MAQPVPVIFSEALNVSAWEERTQVCIIILPPRALLCVVLLSPGGCRACGPCRNAVFWLKEDKSVHHPCLTSDFFRVLSLCFLKTHTHTQDDRAEGYGAATIKAVRCQPSCSLHCYSACVRGHARAVWLVRRPSLWLHPFSLFVHNFYIASKNREVGKSTHPVKRVRARSNTTHTAPDR